MLTDQFATTRPSAQHPFGMAVPHPQLKDLDIKDLKMPYYTDKYWKDLTEDVKFRTAFRMYSSNLEEQLQNNQIINPQREHQIYPIQKLKQNNAG